MKNIYAVIGMGYVGLQVATALANHVKVVGYDINEKRINELKSRNFNSKDKNSQTGICFTSDSEDIAIANFYIVTVSTPAYYYESPKLDDLINAMHTLAKLLNKNDTVIFESTVYPGTTEEICIPILEKNSKMKSGIDFFVGYSPERINPGDKQHTLKNTTKIISGQNDIAIKKVKKMYDLICKKTHIVSSIKTAEAVKILENTQRDVNIALMNEFAKIVHAQDLQINEIINAAATKWNFYTVRPGLVGGHCIPVDPYYLVFKAKRLGIEPRLIVAAREINNRMTKYIIEMLLKLMISNNLTIKNAKICIFGISYKADIPDIRNSMSIKMINELKEYNLKLCIFDPVVDAAEIKNKYNLIVCDFDELNDLTAIIIAQGHTLFKKINLLNICNKLKKKGVIMDLANQFYSEKIPSNRGDITYWSL